MEASDIRFRVIMLEAQKEGIEAELKKLRDVPCPVCQSSNQPGTIERPIEDTGGIIYDKCEACNGTGYVLGEYPR